MKKNAEYTRKILHQCEALCDFEKICIDAVMRETGENEKLLRSNNTFLGSNKDTRFEVFDLPRLISCPGATDICRRHCYQINPEKMHRGKGQDSAVLLHRKYNLLCSLQDNFVDRMFSELKAKKPGEKTLIIRLHADGDFYSEEYLMKWLTVSLACKLAEKAYRFVAYTKSYNILDNVLSDQGKLIKVWQNAYTLADISDDYIPGSISLENFNIRIIASVMDDTNESALKIIQKYNLPKYKVTKGKNLIDCTMISCADCMKCYNITDENNLMNMTDIVTVLR